MTQEVYFAWEMLCWVFRKLLVVALKWLLLLAVFDVAWACYISSVHFIDSAYWIQHMFIASVYCSSMSGSLPWSRQRVHCTKLHKLTAQQGELQSQMTAITLYLLTSENVRLRGGGGTSSLFRCTWQSSTGENKLKRVYVVTNFFRRAALLWYTVFENTLVTYFVFPLCVCAYLCHIVTVDLDRTVRAIESRRRSGRLSPRAVTFVPACAF